MHTRLPSILTVELFTSTLCLRPRRDAYMASYLRSPMIECSNIDVASIY
jgi:hypothetical protein